MLSRGAAYGRATDPQSSVVDLADPVGVEGDPPRPTAIGGWASRALKVDPDRRVGEWLDFKRIAVVVAVVGRSVGGCAGAAAVDLSKCQDALAVLRFGSSEESRQTGIPECGAGVVDLRLTVFHGVMPTWFAFGGEGLDRRDRWLAQALE